MTLRLRLTVFYTVLLGIALVTFSAILYILLANSLINEVDRTLFTSATEVEKRLIDSAATGRTALGISVLLVDPSPISEFASPGIYMQIIDPQGRIRATSANLNGEVMPISPDVIQAALSGTTTVANTSPGQPAEPLRVLTTPLTVAGNVAGVLQVGASLYHVAVTMRSMLTILVLGILATTLLGSAGIWILSGRALRPLVAIATTAEYIGSSQDLSQRLQIHAPNDEVGRLSRAFNTMIGRLEAAFAAQKQFIADSSHELRTPLTVIRGNLDLLKRDPSPEGRLESLTAMEQESVRMAKIVDDLMLLAQLDATQTPPPAPVALDDVVMQVYNQARVLAQDKEVKLGHVDTAIVMANRDRLVQMLLNLVDNAIKYTPAGGTITIECRAPQHGQNPRYAALSVHDTGIGIAPEDLPHIFERFYRADKGHTRTQGGTGLGLAIVRGIAESYGGRVTVQSVPGHGSTFTVLLPAS